MHKETTVADEKSYWEDDRLWSAEARVNLQGDRVAFAASMIPKDVKTVVDLGCGNGLFLNYLSNRSDKRYDRLLGLEKSRTALSYVATETVQSDATRVSIKDETFDLASIMEVVEHLSTKDFSQALNEIARVSKKYILVSVPYKENLKDHFIECKRCKTRFHRNFHKQSFDTGTIKSLFSNLGFRNIDVRWFGKKGDLVGFSSIYKIYKHFNPPPLQVPLPCPVCGFLNGVKSSKTERSGKRVYGYLQRLYELLNRFWPKQYKYIWALGLYERET